MFVGITAVIKVISLIVIRLLECLIDWISNTKHEAYEINIKCVF